MFKSLEHPNCLAFSPSSCCGQYEFFFTHINPQLTHLYVATGIFCSDFLELNGKRGWQARSWICHLQLNLPDFCGAPSLHPQLCQVLSWEFFQFCGSNLIYTLERPAEILKLQPATSQTNQNSYQKLWVGTHLSFGIFHMIPVCSRGGKSLL